MIKAFDDGMLEKNSFSFKLAERLQRHSRENNPRNLI